jgi:hypothetical protein
MRFRHVALVVCALALVFCALVMAAVRPKAHTEYFYLSPGKFSITLGTASATRIAAGKAAGTSSVLVICPKTSSGAVNELQLGFPGAKVNLRKGRYGFSLTYTEKGAGIVSITPVFGQLSHERATVTVTGKVANAKLISGTVSVAAVGCGLPKSKYAASPTKFS